MCVCVRMYIMLAAKDLASRYNKILSQVHTTLPLMSLHEWVKTPGKQKAFARSSVGLPDRS